MKYWKIYFLLAGLAMAGCASQPYVTPYTVGMSRPQFKPQAVTRYYSFYTAALTDKEKHAYEDGYNYGGYPQFIDWNDSQYYHLSYNSLEGYRYR